MATVNARCQPMTAPVLRTSNEQILAHRPPSQGILGTQNQEPGATFLFYRGEARHCQLTFR